MPASNATFIGEIDGVQVVYKPIARRAPAVGLPRRHPRRPRGGGVRRLRGARLEHRAAHLPARRAARPGMVQVWQEPDEEQAAVDIVPEGEVPGGLVPRLRRRRRPRPRRSRWSTRTAAPLRRMAVFDVARQQRRPQGRPRAGDDRRAPLRRRPRRHLPHRPTSCAPSCGAGSARSRSRRRGRRSSEVRGPGGADLGDASATAHALEIEALERRCSRLLAPGVLPAPRGEWPAIPWPPF